MTIKMIVTLMMIMADSPCCCMFTCANSGSSIFVLLACKVDNYYFHFAIEETQDSDVTLTFLRSRSFQYLQANLILKHIFPLELWFSRDLRTFLQP